MNYGDVPHAGTLLICEIVFLCLIVPQIHAPTSTSILYLLLYSITRTGTGYSDGIVNGFC